MENELLTYIDTKVSEGISRAIRDDQYRVSPVQAHRHNGTDSLSIPFANLADATNYRVVSFVTLTSAQILALSTTPVTLVPTMGIKSVIIVEGITARLQYYGTAYTGANALEFRYTDASGAKVTADMAAAFINSSATAYDHVAGVTTELTTVTNAPIVVRVPTANPGAGNSTITFCIVYRVVAFNS